MDYLDADSNPHEHLIKYIKKPLVVLRLCAVVFSIIVFGCLTSQGWRWDKDSRAEVCIINDSYSTCTLGSTVAILSFIISIGILVCEFYYQQFPSSDIRKQFVAADLVLSGLFALLFLVSFSSLSHQWSLSREPRGHYGHSNIGAAIAFSFFSIFIWGLHCALAFRRLQRGADSDIEESLLPGASGGGYQHIGGYTGGQGSHIGGYTGGQNSHHNSEGHHGASKQYRPDMTRTPHFSPGPQELGSPVYRSDQVAAPFSVQSMEPPLSQSVGSEGSGYEELRY